MYMNSHAWNENKTVKWEIVHSIREKQATMATPKRKFHNQHVPWWLCTCVVNISTFPSRLFYNQQGCCLKGAQPPGAPEKILWAPKLFAAAPKTLPVGLLTFWLLSHWAPWNIVRQQPWSVPKLNRQSHRFWVAMTTSWEKTRPHYGGEIWKRSYQRQQKLRIRVPRRHLSKTFPFTLKRKVVLFQPPSVSRAPLKSSVFGTD